MGPKDWTKSYTEVIRLARWLEADGHFECSADAIAYFEKPWNWDNEYTEMIEQTIEQELGLTRYACDNCDGRQFLSKRPTPTNTNQDVACPFCHTNETREASK